MLIPTLAGTKPPDDSQGVAGQVYLQDCGSLGIAKYKKLIGDRHSGRGAFWQLIASPLGLVPTGPQGEQGLMGLNGDPGVAGTDGAALIWEAKTSNFTALGSGSPSYSVNVSGGGVTCTLPPAAAAVGCSILVCLVAVDASNQNIVTVTQDPVSNDPIQGIGDGSEASVSLYYVGDKVRLSSDGTRWHCEDFRQKPFCKLSNSGAQTLTTGVTADITWNTDEFDPHDMHSTSSNTSRVTVKRPGKYRLSGVGYFASNDVGLRQVEFYKDNVALTSNIVSAASVPGGDVVPHTELVEAAAGSFFEMAQFQNSGGNLNTTTQSRFWVEFVGD